ncbi:MAG TPA: DUF6714 family protein [Gemmatimonadales bacterium]|nr:DUF6714 family protein [Gemmatimonadales bacterium]
MSDGGNDPVAAADVARAKALVRGAFAAVPQPARWALRGSSEGTEPFLVEEEFGARGDWTTLDAAFLDQAPDGYGSALSFLSDEAFRHYLPAYLLADLDGALQRVEPDFHLWHGLTDENAARPVNPRRYGARSWADYARFRFSVFTRAEVEAIVAYLRVKAAQDPELTGPRIAQALARYWLPRLERDAERAP